MTLVEWLGITTGILTILAAIIGITRYITQLRFGVRQELLEAEIQRLKEDYSDLEVEHKALADQVARSRRVGMAALALQKTIENELKRAMMEMRASSGSVYVPLTTKSSIEPLGLIFLAILPLNKKTLELRRKITPTKSIAGQCLTTGQPRARPDSKLDPNHYAGADQMSGFDTRDTLTLPLRHQRRTVGVLQLLNKKAPDRFGSQDIPRARPYAESLAPLVDDFLRAPDNLEILGVMPDREAEWATVMICDLTNSSILFREMNLSAATLYLNEYFERICGIALDYGASVENYMGDGVMFKFDATRPVEERPLRAVRAALEMQASFEKLKSDWAIVDAALETLYIRIGIAHGAVNQAVIGHPQHQRLTILGQPVGVAASLCDAAVRDRHVIVIDESAYKMLSGKLIAEMAPTERLGKAVAYIASAYEMRSLIEN